MVSAALAWPAAAFAATGQIDDNGVMIYTADPGEANAITFSFGQDQFGHDAYLVVDAPAALSASLGDGNDTISIQAGIPTSTSCARAARLTATRSTAARARISSSPSPATRSDPIATAQTAA